MKANIELQGKVGVNSCENDTNWYVKRTRNEVLYEVSVLADGTIVMDDGVTQIFQPPAKRRGIESFIEKVHKALEKSREFFVTLRSSV